MRGRTQRHFSVRPFSLRRQQPRRAIGFTLVELVVVITLIGILASIGLSRFFHPETYSLRAYHDQAMAMARYAQKLAVAWRSPVYLRLAADHVALCRDNACAIPVPSPTGNAPAGAAPCNQPNWFCQAAPPGMAVTLANSQGLQTLPQVVAFQAAGGTTLPSNMTVTQQGGGDSFRFTIEAYTGYVHE